MNKQRRVRPSPEAPREAGTVVSLAEKGVGASAGKSDRLSLILSIVALVVSALSVLFTAFDFLGSRAMVLFMEPKTDEAPVDPSAAFTVRSASSEVSVLRVHMHFLAAPKPGTINLQLLGPKLELTSEPFQQLGMALAAIGTRPEGVGVGCTGTIPLLVEVKYVAKGRVHDSAAFYHLAFDYIPAVASGRSGAGYVVLRHLEFNRELSPWQSVRGQSLVAEPCDWTDTAADRNKRDWTIVK